MTASEPTSVVEESVQRLASIHRDHVEAATPVQRFANRITRWLGRPIAVVAVVGAVVLWTAGNTLLAQLGGPAAETWPFPGLEFFAAVAAVVVSLLILTTQQHEEELAKKRAQLTLQIAVLSEQKIAKVIALLEEQRRDNPLLETRVDDEAAKMAVASDPKTSLEQIEASHDPKP